MADMAAEVPDRPQILSAAARAQREASHSMHSASSADVDIVGPASREGSASAGRGSTGPEQAVHGPPPEPAEVGPEQQVQKGTGRDGHQEGGLWAGYVRAEGGKLPAAGLMQGLLQQRGVPVLIKEL